MVVHTSDPNTEELEMGEGSVQGQPCLHRIQGQSRLHETLSYKQIKNYYPLIARKGMSIYLQVKSERHLNF